MSYTPAQGIAASPGNNVSFEEATFSKVTWRLLPLLFLCYVASYLDRVNVGFAKLQMLQDLKFSETIYGLGAGIFFIGYFIFEVPSNIILHKVGARLWIARIMITWGIISGAMIFVTTPEMFYVMRFLLGVAEAGFFPGVILYLTYWYPSHRRGKITALFMTGIAISGVIGGPLSGWIMHAFPGVHGLAGWQWMFILEAIPSLVLGVVVIFYLKDRVRDADWLSAIIYFCFVMGLYGVSFWLPTIIKTTGVSDPLNIGLLTAIPYAIAAIAIIMIGRSADQQRER